MEEDKITLVRNLQTHIIQAYTKIMANLAKYCHDVMGNAPCKFAIIGMGSIARKEITPYSDFEHDDWIGKQYFKKIFTTTIELLSVVFCYISNYRRSQDF